MQTKDLDRVFKNRVSTFKDYVEMFGEDEDTVELYIYDFVAFALAEKSKKKIDYKYAYLLLGLFERAKDNVLFLSGTSIKELYDYVKYNGMPEDLYAVLIKMYTLNEELREVQYKEDYKYITDHRALKEVKEGIAHEIAQEKEKLFSICEKSLLKGAPAYEYEYEDKPHKGKGKGNSNS